MAVSEVELKDMICEPKSHWAYSNLLGRILTDKVKKETGQGQELVYPEY